MSCHSEERRSLDEESFYPSAASTRGPGWGGRAYGASRAPRKVLSVIASEYNERGNLNKTLPSFRAPARHSVGPPLCHSEEVARPTKNLIQGHSERSKESISTLNLCEQLASLFFSCTFLCKKVPKSFCTVKMAASVFGRSLSGHGRLRCSEHPLRALAPSTNEPPPFPRVRNKGSSAPTKTHRHSDYLPVILWCPLPSVILHPPPVILRRSQDRRRI